MGDRYDGRLLGCTPYRGRADFLGQPRSTPTRIHNFAGVFTTGLTAADFHSGSVSPAAIKEKLADATERLLQQGNIRAIVMGCAGMAGLEETIRGVVRGHDRHAGREVFVIDGLKAGVGLLEQMVNNEKMFGRPQADRVR